MGDILSQSEIDELLNALNTGTLDLEEIPQKANERKVKDHDFRRPSKFAKDHIKSLHAIHENYSRVLQNYLSGYLRTFIQLDLISVEAMAYYEYSNSISNPAVLGIVEFSPLPGNVIFELSPNITFALIDRLLGGRGVAIEKIRGFTEVELVIVERLMTQMLNLLKEPWAGIAAIKPKLDKIETNSQFAQIISPNEIVVLITLNIKVGDAEGMINLCIPHIVVEPVISNLNTKVWYSVVEKETSEESKQSIEIKINHTRVPVKAILGNTTISVNEFLTLKANDVLPLDTNVNGSLSVMVGDMHKFNAVPGVKKNRVAIKIVEVVKKEDE